MKPFVLALLFLTGCAGKEKFYFYFSKSGDYYPVIPHYIDHQRKCVGDFFIIARYSEIQIRKQKEWAQVYHCPHGTWSADCEKWSSCPTGSFWESFE